MRLYLFTFQKVFIFQIQTLFCSSGIPPFHIFHSRYGVSSFYFDTDICYQTRHDDMESTIFRTV